MSVSGNCNGVMYTIHTDMGGDSRGIKLFDKKLVGTWSGDAVYWAPNASGYTNTKIIDISFNVSCKICVYKHADFPTQYNNKLNIKKLIDGNFVDITNTITQIQPTTIIGSKEYDYIPNISAGRYQFTLITGYSRMDMEWVLYSNTKFGLFAENNIFDIVGGSLTVRDDASQITNDDINMVEYVNRYNKSNIIKFIK